MCDWTRFHLTVTFRGKKMDDKEKMGSMRRDTDTKGVSG